MNEYNKRFFFLQDFTRLYATNVKFRFYDVICIWNKNIEDSRAGRVLQLFIQAEVSSENGGLCKTIRPRTHTRTHTHHTHAPHRHARTTQTRTHAHTPHTHTNHTHTPDRKKLFFPAHNFLFLMFCISLCSTENMGSVNSGDVNPLHMYRNNTSENHENTTITSTINMSRRSRVEQ